MSDLIIILDRLNRQQALHFLCMVNKPEVLEILNQTAIPQDLDERYAMMEQALGMLIEEGKL